MAISEGDDSTARKESNRKTRKKIKGGEKGVEINAELLTSSPSRKNSVDPIDSNFSKTCITFEPDVTSSSTTDDKEKNCYGEDLHSTETTD